MNGFWEFLIRPALEAVDAREIVEVGSEGGVHTRRILAWCAERGARLHVIDPEPAYDPETLRAAHPGRLVFHRAPSLDVVGKIDAADAVLLDGDHNWYTVFHELTALEAVHGERFPLVLLHDVAWPFARRDMYYAPERIPAEHRHAYARGGLVRGEEQLAPAGGLAPELDKALHEGGPRNGVLTAVEDFLARTRLALRFALLPVDFGLGLLVSEALLASKPALRALFDGLSEPGFDLRLALHTEERRIDTFVELQREIVQLRDQAGWAVTQLSAHQAELARHVLEVARLRERLDADQAEIAAARDGARAQGEELERWHAHAAGLEARVAERTRERERFEAEARSLEARARELGLRLSDASAQATEAQACADALALRLDATTARASESEARAGALDAALARLLGSRSWRATAPLRHAAGWLRRARGERSEP